MIVGGAVVPVLMGILTDSASLKIALLAPIICYAYIAFFGLKGSKIRQST
jgi:FHS family L-fucose permease-like MFS transporter